MSFGNRRILWCNISGAHVNGLDLACPIRVVASLDDGQDCDRIAARSGVRFLNHERITGRREVAHDVHAPQLTGLLGDAILDALRDGPPSSWIVASPRPAGDLSSLAAAAGCRAVVLPADLCHWLNHKANFFAGRRRLGLAQPPGEWRRLGMERFNRSLRKVALETGTQFDPAAWAEIEAGYSAR